MLSIFSCCFGKEEAKHNVSEQTPLLNPDIIPVVEQLPQGQTTEQQLAQQDALRKILDHAAEQFINIESPTPVPGPSVYSCSHSISPDSTTASPKNRNSTWRGIDSPVIPISTNHLTNNFEPIVTNEKKDVAIGRPGSKFSLKQMNSTPNDSSHLGVEEVPSRKERSEDGESNFDTFRTAREGGESRMAVDGIWENGKLSSTQQTTAVQK